MKRIIVSLIVIIGLFIGHSLFFGKEYDLKTFRDVGLWRWIKTDSLIGYYELKDNSLYFSYSEDGIEHRIDGADIETFMVCQGTDYAKDKNGFYYFGTEGSEEGDIFLNRLQNIAGDSIKYIGDNCAIIENSLYYKGMQAQYDEQVLEKLYKNFQ